MDATCEPPLVSVTTEATAVAVLGFDAITLQALALVRPVDPADTALVEQVCEVAGDPSLDGKLKGKRLEGVVDALNALGGTWQPAPAPAPAAG